MRNAWITFSLQVALSIQYGSAFQCYGDMVRIFSITELILRWEEIIHWIRMRKLWHWSYPQSHGLYEGITGREFRQPLETINSCIFFSQEWYFCRSGNIWGISGPALSTWLMASPLFPFFFSSSCTSSFSFWWIVAIWSPSKNMKSLDKRDLNCKIQTKGRSDFNNDWIHCLVSTPIRGHWHLNDGFQLLFCWKLAFKKFNLCLKSHTGFWFSSTLVNILFCLRGDDH